MTATSNTTSSGAISFEWERQPVAASIVEQLYREALQRSSAAERLRARMLAQTGTRMLDWIDYLAPPNGEIDKSELEAAGFAFVSRDGVSLAEHMGGMFPTIRIDSETWSIGVKVESVDEFLQVNGLNHVSVDAPPWAPMRSARIAKDDQAELCVVERHGYLGYDARQVTADDVAAVLKHSEAFRCRHRRFKSDDDGFNLAIELATNAVRDVGVDRACDLFFRAEREYWESRNRAARLQRSRQDRLGLGWGNHDHHTYRSSREHFRQLIELLETLGLRCRERFYAGVEAGWGAQVLEQPACRLMVFADVDLSPEEVSGDFAHRQLERRKSLGTVGLWCCLHGEAALQAGMHHLEAQFDFDAAREQLAAVGVQTMAPFTDFPFLKQAFTRAEMWAVEPQRIAMAREAGYITRAQAEQFAHCGAVGSHLEILERNEGYKGFNQTGISQIIRRTDPRGQSVGA